MKVWKRIEPTVVNKIGYRTIVTKTFKLPDDSTKGFQTIDQEDTHFSGVVALTEDNQVIVAQQFRPGPEKIMTEIPGGKVDGGEDYQAAAVRELAEETGYNPGKIISIGQIYKSAYSNGIHHYYFATNCQRVVSGQQLDDSEFIDVKLISPKEFIANALKGQMTDIGAVLLAYERLVNLS
jgi:ADP-ribose pyrophosphatase